MQFVSTFYLTIFFLLLPLFSCDKKHPEKEKIKPTVENPYANSLIEIKTLQDSLGWVYNIYIDNRMYIHQPHIPAVNGKIGFSNEENARKTAELVVFKIRNNIMPPSVTVQELDSLHVLN